MESKKLTASSSSELSSELKKAGLSMSGKKFDEKEALVRLTTDLIDKGEDPTSYEFSIEASDDKSEKKDASGLNETTKQQFLDKIVRFERNYFTSRGLRSCSVAETEIVKLK